MKRFNTIVVAILIAGLCGAVAATPAPWFKWRSKVDGKQVCAQVLLGHGWERPAAPIKIAIAKS
jgi:hypothetical protein